jgi:DNA-binding transcriptional MerR regulator
MRPVDLARAIGMSAQTVRKYERHGFLRPAARRPSGHRRYTADDLRALRLARLLIAGYGWEPARRVMAAVHRGDTPAVLAAVDRLHAELDLERRRTEEMVRALRAAGPAASAAGPDRRPRRLTVGEAARRAGVRVSALRFWEARRLLEPSRDGPGRYRRYDEAQARRVQIVALLRRAGYDLAAVAAVLSELRAGRPEDAVRAAERRLAALTEASRRRAAATAALWGFLEERAAASAAGDDGGTVRASRRPG